jgi:DNA replication protein DnaC
MVFWRKAFGAFGFLNEHQLRCVDGRKAETRYTWSGRLICGKMLAFLNNLKSASSNLPFDERTEVFGSELLTGALLDRQTHHVHILEMNSESYRLKHSPKSRQ